MGRGGGADGGDGTTLGDAELWGWGWWGCLLDTWETVVPVVLEVTWVDRAGAGTFAIGGGWSGSRGFRLGADDCSWRVDFGACIRAFEVVGEAAFVF